MAISPLHTPSPTIENHSRERLVLVTDPMVSSTRTYNVFKIASFLFLYSKEILMLFV